jgi:hypothetical protein
MGRSVDAARANGARELEDERRDILCCRFPRLHRFLYGPTDPVAGSVLKTRRLSVYLPPAEVRALAGAIFMFRYLFVFLTPRGARSRIGKGSRSA